MTDRYAVIGNPVAHSKSPWIHAQFARACGEDMAYGAIEAPPEGFVAAVEQFRAGGGKGLNVTLPFKEQAFRFCAGTSARAAAAQAVNTLVLDRGAPYGDNTDDAPSDRWPTFYQEFRETPRYGADVAALVAEASRKYGVADWTFIGTSEGSLSAFHAARMNPELARRVILTSSVFVAGKNGPGLSRVKFDALRSELPITPRARHPRFLR